MSNIIRKLREVMDALPPGFDGFDVSGEEPKRTKLEKDFRALRKGELVNIGNRKTAKDYPPIYGYEIRAITGGLPRYNDGTKLKGVTTSRIMSYVVMVPDENVGEKDVPESVMAQFNRGKDTANAGPFQFRKNVLVTEEKPFYTRYARKLCLAYDMDNDKVYITDMDSWGAPNGHVYVQGNSIIKMR